MRMRFQQLLNLPKHAGSALGGALLLTLVLAAVGAAQDVDGGHHRRGRGFRAFDPTAVAEKIARHVDLSQEQRERIEQLTETFRRDHAEVLERARRMREEIRAQAGEGERPDRAQIDELAERYGRPLRELRPAMRELREDVLEVLTPEQRRRLEELRKERREDRTRHRPHGSHAPGR